MTDVPDGPRMVGRVPADLVGVMDAVLAAIDPRRPDAEREQACLEACRDPETAIGFLAQIVLEYHVEGERFTGKPPGALTDALRAKVYGAADPDVLGHAIDSVSAGQSVRFVPVMGPTARDPEESRRGALRLHEELPPLGSESDPLTPGQPYTEAPVDGHDFPAEDFTRNGITVVDPGDPALAGLLDSLRRSRAEEQAVDAADLGHLDDLTGTTGQAMVPAPPRLTTPAPAPAAPPDPQTRPAPALGFPWNTCPHPGTYRGQTCGICGAVAGEPSGGGNAASPPPAQASVCGAHTPGGPCILLPGHPAGEGFPGYDGHVSNA